MLTATGWLSDFGHHDESLAAYDKSALADLFRSFLLLRERLRATELTTRTLKHQMEIRWE
jgi:hypothetical protein